MSRLPAAGRVVAVAAAVSVGLGCGESATDALATGGGTAATGPSATPGEEASPVLTVAGQGLSLEELRWAREALAAADGPLPRFDDALPEARVGPRSPALAALLARELLAVAAARRGFDEGAAVERVATQAMVQRLLAEEVEAPLPPSAFSDDEVRARYEGDDRFVAPERRSSRHLLARFPARLARVDAFADEVREPVREVLAPILETVKAAGGIDPAAPAPEATLPEGMTWVVEEVPPFGPDGSLDPAYRDALFSLPGPGVVPRIVESTFGFHLIEVTEVTPARRVPFAEAEPALRREMAVEARRERLEELLTALRQQARVVVDQAAMAGVLALPAERLGAVFPADRAR
jgi:peptidyl-prolyl cis-trans isomerase D